jgi:hypothetical protein
LDTFEILSTVRDYSGLKTEEDISQILLKRYVNLGHMFVGQILLPIFKEFLVKTKAFTNITAAFVDVPDDVLQILDVEREDIATTFLRLCTRVPVEDKGVIGKGANYQPSADYPFYLHEGKELYVYPTLVTADVNMRYKKRIEDLAEGPATYASAVTATLGGNASPDDDAYNSYNVAIYERAAASLTLKGIYKCTDYVGATKLITLSGVTFQTPAHYYYFALVPVIPAEFHNFIIDAGMVELGKAHLIEGDWSARQTDLNNRLNATLAMHGFGEARK